MAYNYNNYTTWLSSIEGSKAFLRVRDWCNQALHNCGAFTEGKAMSAAGSTPDSFHAIACIDHLVQLGEIEQIPGQTCASQNRVYRKKIS